MNYQIAPYDLFWETRNTTFQITLFHDSVRGKHHGYVITGAGVAYASYGHDRHEGKTGMTRPQLVHQLAQEWTAAMPDVAVRLATNPPARVADIGMGHPG